MEYNIGMIKTKKVYDNCAMLGPDGQCMAHVARHRMNWYIKKGIATKIDDKTFQLNFIPKGNGCSDVMRFYGKREDKCVICGTIDNLTLHHVVPSCFRRLFPSKFKSRNCFDVVCLCHKCHEIYEKEAIRHKKLLRIAYGFSSIISLNKEDQERSHIKRMLNAIVNFRNQIPDDRLIEMYTLLSEHFGYEVNDDNIQDLNNNYVSRKNIDQAWGIILKKYLEKHDIIDFILMWREHFLQYAKPKYLNDGWLEGYKLVETMITSERNE